MAKSHKDGANGENLEFGIKNSESEGEGAGSGNPKNESADGSTATNAGTCGGGSCGAECGESGYPAADGELTEQRDKYLRLAAEYDNFRKRSKIEKETTYQQARIDAITRLLPVYDNLERALKMDCSDEAFYKGIEMTFTSLNEIFENMDVKQIPAVGEPFDPNRHNAVVTIENPELGEKIVAEEFQKGFMLGDKVIRFSTVVVAN